MAQYVTLEELKQHLNVDFDTDDAYITGLIEPVQLLIESYLNNPLDTYVKDAKIDRRIWHAIRILIANYYASYSGAHRTITATFKTIYVMQAGLLNEMIAFYRSESKRDNLGGTSESWVKVFDKRAYIRFKSGARKEANGEIYNTTVNTIMIRICKEINAKMRIEYDGQKYKILSINHDRKQQATVIEAEVINE